MSDQPKNVTSRPTPSTEWMPIHFRKSNYFRVVHADAAWFSASPSGSLHIIFYSDRNPAPDDLVVRAKEDGTFEEIKSETNALEGVFREMEVDVVMTAEGVKQLYEFLGKNLGIKT